MQADFIHVTVVRALWGLLMIPGLALAFDSGSTGTDGDFNPTADTQLQLPADGILNFKSVNIPTGVTVSFKKNAANTPVYLLAQGNLTLAGKIDISGGNSTDVSAAGNGNLTDDGIPGAGGPGGYDGGWGGYPLYPQYTGGVGIQNFRLFRRICG